MISRFHSVDQGDEHGIGHSGRALTDEKGNKYSAGTNDDKIIRDLQEQIAELQEKLDEEMKSMRRMIESIVNNNAMD